MPPLDALGLLQDVLDAGAFMQARGAQLTPSQYLQNQDLRVVFERKFEIIGEALGLLRKRHPEFFARVRRAARAIDFRNAISHGYSSVNHEIVWQVFEPDLPELLADAGAIMEELKRM